MNGVNGTTRKREPQWPVTVGVYGMLFLFGAVQGLIGSFQYSGAVLPGIGWILASFLLSMPVSNGSVIITSTKAGEWYLYGGTLSVAAGVVASFVGVARWAGRR